MRQVRQRGMGSVVAFQCGDARPMRRTSARTIHHDEQVPLPHSMIGRRWGNEWTERRRVGKLTGTGLAVL
jgi:hypothetical protein